MPKLELDIETLNRIGDAIEQSPDCPAKQRIKDLWAELALHRARMMQIRSVLQHHRPKRRRRF